MNKVQRYAMMTEYERTFMQPDPAGFWCKASDCASLEARLKEAKALLFEVTITCNWPVCLERIRAWFTKEKVNEHPAGS